MTKITNDKENIKSSNPIPGILAAIGVFLMLGGAGNADYYDAAEQENQSAGYEKNIIHQSDYDKANKTMLWGGILTGVGIIGLLRKERENAR